LCNLGHIVEFGEIQDNSTDCGMERKFKSYIKASKKYNLVAQSAKQNTIEPLALSLSDLLNDLEL